MPPDTTGLVVSNSASAAINMDTSEASAKPYNNLAPAGTTPRNARPRNAHPRMSNATRCAPGAIQPGTKGAPTVEGSRLL